MTEPAHPQSEQTPRPDPTPSAPGDGRSRPPGRTDRRRSPSRLLSLRADFLAALTVTLVGIPQCLAYALMAGLPPAYGLATAAVPGFIAALTGRVPHVVTGPTNTTGLLILVALTPFLTDNGLLAESALPVLATLTILAGLIRLTAAYAGGAVLIEFLPASVLVGFTAGAGLLIAVMQLDEGLGLLTVRGGSLLGEIRAVAAILDQVAWPSVAVTLATIAAIAAGKRVIPRWPITLLAVLIAAGLSYALGLDHTSGLPVVGDRSSVPSGWPPGALPSLDLELIRSLLAPAAAIALLGTLELAVAIQQGVSGQGGDVRPDMRREIASQGLANLAGAFASGFPASASLTRSALISVAGGRSRLAPALSALFVVPVLFFAGPVVAAIPQASLAGVLMFTAYRMVAKQPIVRMWLASPVTRFMLVATFLATLFLPLEIAILGGAGIGAIIHLAQSNRPRLQLLEPRGARLVPIDDRKAVSSAASLDVVIVEVSGDMHYAATQRFMRDARARIPTCARHVIIDLSHARELRFAALMRLEELAGRVIDCGGILHLSGVDGAFAEILHRAGSTLPYTPYDPEPLASIRACLARVEEPAESGEPASTGRQDDPAT